MAKQQNGPVFNPQYQNVCVWGGVYIHIHVYESCGKRITLH